MRLVRVYQYRMANIVWKQWVGPGRMGIIHNEPFLLQRLEGTRGFQWTLKRKRTGETWEGVTIQWLVEQTYLDLHCEKFDVEDLSETDGPGQWCVACDPHLRAMIASEERNLGDARYSARKDG